MDSELGAVLSSSYEYPGRYTRWDMALGQSPAGAGSRRPPSVEIRALNDRGKVILPAVAKTLKSHPDVESFEADGQPH